MQSAPRVDEHTPLVHWQWTPEIISCAFRALRIDLKRLGRQAGIIPSETRIVLRIASGAARVKPVGQPLTRVIRLL